MGDIRDQGLFIGIEWVSNKTTKAADPKAAKHMADLLMQKGVLVSNAGQQGNVLKIRPPLVFNKSDADYFLNIFTDVLKENKSTSFPQ
jgi:4-aminobutyrate aminotransferase-like enzyme